MIAMKYRALDYFEDLQDGNHAYHVGDIFPRKGKKVSKARLAELASGDNARGRPVIEAIEEPADESTLGV